MTLCPGNGLIHVVELDGSRSEVWIASRIADKVDRCRRQIRLLGCDKTGGHSNRESKAAIDRTINLLIAPGADGSIFAIAAWGAPARAVILDAAISLRLAKLRLITRENGGLLAQVHGDGQHSGGCVVLLIRNPISRWVGSKGKAVVIDVYRAGGNSGHGLGLRYIANVEAIGLFCLWSRVNEVDFVLAVGEKDIGNACAALVGCTQGSVDVIVSVIDRHGAALSVALSHHADRWAVLRIRLIRRELIVG